MRPRSHRPPGLRSVLALLALALAVLAAGWAPAPATAATIVASAEAESGTLDGWYLPVVADGAASGGAAVKFGWIGSVRFTVKLAAAADAVTLRVRGDQCGGAPPYRLTVDGAAVAEGAVAETTWTGRSHGVRLLAGRHTVEVRYTADHTQPWPAACDRNLYLDAVTFSSTGVAATTPAQLAVPGFVHQQGTQLLDGAGRPLRLRGVNLGGWLLWEGWIWGSGMDYVGESKMMDNLAQLVGREEAERFRAAVRANYVTEADFAAIAAYGLNVARVPINYRLLEDDAAPFTYKAAGWAVLDKLVQDARRHGVYLVLDLHAAPCGQMRGFVADFVGPDDLWGSAACRDRTVALWKAIAARYANEDVVAGYDLLNESITGDGQLLALYRRLTAAVREVDPNHLLIYEGNVMGRTFDLFSEPLDTNQMLSFHDYPWAFPGEDLGVRMARYVAAAKRLNTPQWAGEFGQSTDEDVRRYVDTFDREPALAGWALWTWKQSPGFSALQTIEDTAASKKLILWMNETSRPRPTPAEAQQGMADFAEAIRFENTAHDASFRRQLDCRDGCATAAPAPDTGGEAASAPAATDAGAPAAPAPAPAPAAPRPAPSPSPAAPTAAPVGASSPLRVTVGRARLAQALRDGLRLSAVAPGPGRITAVATRAGKPVARGSATADRSATKRVDVAFTRAAREALRRTRKVALVVEVSFRPARGRALTETVKRTLAR